MRFHKTGMESCKNKVTGWNKKRSLKNKSNTVSIRRRKVLCDGWRLINSNYLFIWKKKEMLWRVTKISLLLSDLIFSSCILHGKLVNSGPDLPGSTHYVLCSWVPRGGFNQPQHHVLCLQSWVGRISGYGGLNTELEPPWIFIFTGRPRNKWIPRNTGIPRDEFNFISQANKERYLKEKSCFSKGKKKSILCDLKKNAET